MSWGSLAALPVSSAAVHVTISLLIAVPIAISVPLTFPLALATIPGAASAVPPLPYAVSMGAAAFGTVPLGALLLHLLREFCGLFGVLPRGLRGFPGFPDGPLFLSIWREAVAIRFLASGRGIRWTGGMAVPHSLGFLGFGWVAIVHFGDHLIAG